MRSAVDQNSLRTWLLQLLVAASYVACGEVIHRYLLHHGIVSAFWPGSGILLGALLLGGRRYLWAALLGTLVLNLHSNSSWIAIAGITLSNLVEVELGYRLLKCHKLTEGCLDTLPRYLRFSLLGGAIASLAGAGMGTLTLYWAASVPAAEIPYNLWHWWMGDMLGVIIITPLMLAWRPGSNTRLSAKAKLEAVLLGGLALFAGQIVFLGWFNAAIGDTPKAYWMFLFVIWAAMRFGARGLTTLVLVLAIQALLGAYQEVGYFARDVRQSELANYWSYMLMLSFMGMAVSTHISALRRALVENRLKDAALNVAAHGVYITDPQGVIEWSNPAYSRNTGYSQQEIRGRKPCDLVKSGEQDAAFYRALWDTIMSKQVWRGEMINLRKDGSRYNDEITITPILGATGEIVHYVAVEQDITARKLAERELLHQSEKNLALLRNASDGIHILDRAGNVIEVSDSFCTMLGYSREEVLGMNVAQWDARYAPGERASLMQAQFDSPLRSEVETRYRCKDGSVIDVEVSGSRVEMDGRAVLFNSSRDIGERKRISAALQQQLRFANGLNRISRTLVEEDDPELILQQTVQIVGEMLEADRTLIYDVSFDMRKVTGLSEWLNPHHPETQHSKGIYPLEVFSSGAHHLKRSKTWFTSHSESINHYLKEDGSGEFLHHAMKIRSLLWYPFAFTENGFYALVINQIYSHRDWTMPEIDFLDSVSHIVSLELEKIRMTQQGKEAEARLRIAATAFESQEGMMITDAGKRLLQVNRAFTAITGYTQEDVLGKTPRLLSSGRHGADFYREMWDTIERTGTWEGEIWNKRKNGEIYPEHLTVTAVKDGAGRITHYVGALTDSTQREQVMEQLRNSASELARANAQIEAERSQLAQRVEERTAQLIYANKAKDSFLATMSHEIRTPLGGMLGMMELLGLSHLDEEQAEMLKVAHHSGKSLLRIVDDILDWSKIEAGKLELAPRAISVAEVLKSVTDTYAQLASAKDVLLAQHVDARLATAHMLDPLRVSQILNNFTSNAIKFTDHGTVMVGAERVAQDDSSETVRFSVQDTGVGISADQQQRLFQHYEQGSAETARLYGGTGLGLAICRSLAELMGGQIEVQSEPGRGSTFSFILRMDKAGEVEQGVWQAHAAPDAEQLVQQRTEIGALVGGDKVVVLVVDDHPVNRIVIRQQLQQLGVGVEIAEDGQAGLQRWQQGRFDLVITDCHMPEMDGYQLTRAIRELEGAAGHTPILAWTANVMAEEERRSRAAGMDDVLTKPTELSLLRGKLLQWLPQLHIHTASAGEVLERNVLAQLFPDAAAQVRVLQEFYAQHLRDCAVLRVRREAGASAQLAETAHRMKGACRMVGASELAELCLRIEQAAKHGDLLLAGVLLGGALENCNARFGEQLRRYGTPL